ncbi:MAG: response regulator [Planctomycetes bacterium]|nr:response regulator [Planctomycetota bacterium]
MLVTPETCPARHDVQFHDDDDGADLDASLVAFLSEGLSRGEGALVIARPARWARLAARLAADGLAPPSLAERLVVVDAREVVAPGRSLEAFIAAAVPVLDALAARGPVRAYGEAVDVLLERGRAAEAVRLEALWSQALAGRPVTLRCGYARRRFAGDAGAATFEAVCDAHGDVVVTDDPGATGPPALRRRLARLERDALDLAAERARRRRVEDRLSLLARAADRLDGATDAGAVAEVVLDLAVPALGDVAVLDILPPWDRRFVRGDDAGAAARPLRATDAAADATLRVPLQGPRGQVGALSIHLLDGGRRLDAADQALMGELGGRAAAALEAVRLREEARAAVERQRQAERRRDEFLAMLGHELRNPLAPILTALELMERRAEGSASRERAIIERQARHLARLLDDLLDLSRLERGKLALDLASVSLMAAVERAVALARPSLDRGRHALTVDVPPDLRVRADPERLAQALGQLVANAARYTPDVGHVQVRAAREGDLVRVDVSDDGVGLSPELLQRVFEPFVQGPRALDRPGGGLGVGLAVARSLIALHGGALTATSPGVGGGSTFTVRLPLAEPEAAPPPAPADAPRHRRVLVVDDNVDAADLLGEALRTLGFEVAVAHGAEGALDLAGPFAPDVALVDLGMPGIDGFELAQRLRGRGVELRLVALTGYGQDHDRARTREAGFDAHLVKPAPLDVIVAALAA